MFKSNTYIYIYIYIYKMYKCIKKCIYCDKNYLILSGS